MSYFFGKSENEIRKIIGDKFKNYRSYIIVNCDNPEETKFAQLFNCNYSEFFECEHNYKQETKMTRQEAIEKLCVIQPKPGDPIMLTIAAAGFADGLEALGLIKFDEPKPIKYVTVEDIDGDVQRVKLSNAIRAIENAGYRVYQL